MTAIELVLVLGIVVTLAAIAVPRYVNSIARYRVDAAARRIAADLAYAQNAARAGSTSVTLAFNLSTSSYSVSGVPDLSRPTASYAVNLATDPYTSKLNSVSFPNGQNAVQVIFDGYGYPNSAGTIVLTSGVFSKTVLLDPSSGKVTIQ